MEKRVKVYFDKELLHYKDSLKSRQFDACWDHLERAHILGQLSWKYHFITHYLMFSLAFKTKNFKEIIGQIPRLFLAIPGSLFGKAPRGNIGSSKVGIFEPMALPEDLKCILEVDKK